MLSLPLSASDGGGGNYPTDWPPLVSQQLAQRCSHLRATYVLDEIHRDDDATTFSVLSTLLGGGDGGVQRALVGVHHHG